MKAVQAVRAGGTEVLEVVDVDLPDPTGDEIHVAVSAAGVNFIDVYERMGLYPKDYPFVVGQEGAGSVIATGENVTGFAPGDVVAWTSAPGGYATEALIPQHRVAPVPSAISPETAAAVMLQGLTAHYLVNDTFPLRDGHRCLVHAGAGGVGGLLIQLAKAKGAEVFTTVGSREKAELAKAAGADHTILYEEEDFGEVIEALTGPNSLDVVYDGVGAATFDRGLALLRPLGMMVTFGNASGRVPPVDPLRLAFGGSLYLTRPTLGHYIATAAELRRRAADLFAEIGAGRLRVNIGGRYPLAAAAEAHRDLESRATTGKLILVTGD